MKKGKLIFLIGTLTIFGLLFYTTFNWFVNRIYVPEGSALMLRYKGPMIFGSGKLAAADQWAKEGEVGTLEKMKGPGRHFYCPIWWERTIVPDTIILPGEVGIVTAKIGDESPNSESFLADGEIGEVTRKGVMRKVLGPGSYRINPRGYDVKIIKSQINDSGKTKKYSGWVEIPPGFVGVVTNLTDNPILGQKAGIQQNTLPPGLYPINPYEQQINIVGIGYWETTVDIENVAKMADLIKAEEKDINLEIKGGIKFPSSDGFEIVIDYTAIWGLLPNQAADAIRKFGDPEMIRDKVILPQIGSLCRGNGSEYKADQLLIGEEREKFQTETLDEFKKICNDKGITLQFGLVRHTYVPKEVRKPIQMSFIADEMKLTRIQEQMTAREEAALEEAKSKVNLATETTIAETKKLVAEKIAEGDKKVAEIVAQTRQLSAAIEKETAQLKSAASLAIGKATSEGDQLIENAKSSKFKLAVEAFGTPNAYNNWTFANGLPKDIEFKAIFAGPGTLWTNIKDGPTLTVPVPVQPSK